MAMSRINGAKLPRAARLRGHDAFGRIFRQGDGLRRGDIVLKYVVDEPGAGTIRAGFVVRRNVGSAVKRNRMRRLLREAYRSARPELAARIPAAVDLQILLIWSGSPETALRPRLSDLRAQMGAAIDALARRLRTRTDGTAATKAS